MSGYMHQAVGFVMDALEDEKHKDVRDYVLDVVSKNAAHFVKEMDDDDIQDDFKAYMALR